MSSNGLLSKHVIREKNLDSKEFNCQAVILKVLFKKIDSKSVTAAKGLQITLGLTHSMDEEMRPRGRKGLAQPSGELLNQAHSNSPTGVCWRCQSQSLKMHC